MKQYSLAEVKNKMVSLGYKWPPGVHIVGIRALKEINDTFCDQLICFSPSSIPIQGVGTTVPARVYLIKPQNPKGTAVLKEGQYLDSWMIGTHHLYQALVQCKPVTVYRDSNRDAIIDQKPRTEDTGLFGINIHKYINVIVAWLGNSSMGCQVWQDINKFNTMMALCEKSGQKFFSYTLIHEW